MPTRWPICSPVDAAADRFNAPDDLVARDDGQLGIGQLAVEHVQVRAANAAGGYVDANLALPRLPIRQFGPFQRRTGLRFNTIACMLRTPTVSAFACTLPPWTSPNEAIVVPHSQLPAETLRAVVESFVLREGTEYGERDFTLDEKVAHVLAQLERGLAQVVFEPESQSVEHRHGRTGAAQSLRRCVGRGGYQRRHALLGRQVHLVAGP
jgi:uncharacterized protein YheU (UPF0270 family)